MRAHLSRFSTYEQGPKPLFDIEPFSWRNNDSTRFSRASPARDPFSSTNRHAAARLLQSSLPVQRDQDFVQPPKPSSFLRGSLLVRSLNLRYTVRTRAGTLYGRFKLYNQDDFIFMPKVCGHDQVHLVGVVDGHGSRGRLVTEFVTARIPLDITEMISSLESTMLNYSQIAELQRTWREKIYQLHYDLIHSVKCDGSGAVLSLVLFVGIHCFCCSLGDCKALLANQSATGWEFSALSKVHKPTLPSERIRIEARGGRISQSVDQSGNRVGPPRVWNGSTRGPSVSRALGDLQAARVGVSQEAEITHTTLKRSDKFIVVGTDGLWNQLSDDQVLAIVTPHYRCSQLEEACSAVLEAAVNKSGSHFLDDVTVIVIYL